MRRRILFRTTNKNFLLIRKNYNLFFIHSSSFSGIQLSHLHRMRKKPSEQTLFPPQKRGEKLPHNWGRNLICVNAHNLNTIKVSKYTQLNNSKVLLKPPNYLKLPWMSHYLSPFKTIFFKVSNKNLKNPRFKNHNYRKRDFKIH